MQVTKTLYAVEIQRNTKNLVKGCFVQGKSRNGFATCNDVIATFEKKKDAIEFRETLYFWHDECKINIIKFTRQ